MTVVSLIPTALLQKCDLDTPLVEGESISHTLESRQAPRLL